MVMGEESGKPDPPQEEERRPWSALPHDPLRLIVEQLNLVERIRFRTVCKDWLLAPIHDLQSIDHKLPWIMNYRFTLTTSVCLLFQPCRRQPYIVEDKQIKPGRRGLPPGRPKLPYATVCASRSGWVLFTRDIQYSFERVVEEMAGNASVTSYLVSCLTPYFVYNVLSKNIITLPDLKAPQHQTHSSNLVTFSSVPTSPDCVFFVPHPSTSDQVFISTYSIGDESWKTHSFTCPHASSYSPQSVVYMQGSFYCFSVRGLLASFNIATQEWRPLVSIMWDMPSGKRRSYFLEYGGRLIIVFTKRQSHFSRPECDIFRFDWSDRVWIKMESLEGGAIFLGKPGFGVPAGERTKMFANRVYYFDWHKPEFFTYGPVSPGIGSESQELMVYPDTWHPEIEPGPQKRMDCSDIWEPDRLRGDLIWIDPPLLKPWRG